MNSPISMLNPPSPVSAITWRERSSTCTPLAWPSAVVERADDPLRSGLPNPVPRPQRVQAGVENKDRIAARRVADRARHGLRVNAVLAPLEIALLVQHLIPFPALVGDLVPEPGVGLGRNAL